MKPPCRDKTKCSLMLSALTTRKHKKGAKGVIFLKMWTSHGTKAPEQTHGFIT